MNDTLQKSPRKWTIQDDERLVTELAEGTSVPAIAEILERSEKALVARARKMLPPDDPDGPKGTAVFAWLRPRLQHGYDWRGPLYRSTAPGRAYEPWSYDEHETLITELRHGLSWPDIAQAHERSAGAVRSRALLMIVDEIDGSTPRRPDRLRELLATDPDYDWPAALRRNCSLPAILSPAEEETLRDAWASQTSLPDLASALAVSEFALVRSFVSLGLAASLTEVAERLGCTLGGTVDVRRRIAADPAQAAVVVLIGSDDTGVRHVSLHLSPEEAAVQHLAGDAESWTWMTRTLQIT